MTITLYGYGPAWGLACVSPFVTKVTNYLTMADIPFTFVQQDPTTLHKDSPTAKLPRIVDEDGTQVHDSTRIIQYLKDKYGDKLDASLSPAQHAQGLAFQRMVEEYTYWTGIIQPRWRYPAEFEKYIPFMVGTDDPPPPVREFLYGLRDRIADQQDKQGTGKRSDEDVLVALKEDLDAIEAFIGDKQFLLGDQPTSYDATVYSTLRQITDPTPWDWAGRDYALSKTGLVAYENRMRERFGV